MYCEMPLIQVLILFCPSHDIENPFCFDEPTKGRLVFCFLLLRTQIRTIRRTNSTTAKIGPTTQTMDAFFGLGRPFGSPG